MIIGFISGFCAQTVYVQTAYPDIQQCSKLLPVRLPEADNFGGGPGTFFKIFLNFMFMIWDSRQEDWQLFWLSFEHCIQPVPAPILFCARHIKDFVFVLHRCLDTGLTTQNHVVFNCIFTVPGQFRRVLCIFDQYISENAIFLLWLKFSGLLTATGSTTEETFAIRPPRPVLFSYLW